ncbi:M48 metallopeptidase family protein [Streptomyces fulvorobeus]|uniref:M48 metallopeptidase family protein n=1 Tax=Streptomyces fulvorobeus TaxID=284028 RepID=UPI00273FF9A9|nr:M48 family metallopeptidase [Streptomyces fulvorobeus]
MLLGFRTANVRSPRDERARQGRPASGMAAVPTAMHRVGHVIAHELAHVRVPGHGTDFWRLLGRALPGYEE